MAHDTQMLIRIGSDLKQLVTEVAANEDRSIAWIVRKALHDFVSARPEAARLHLRLVDPSAPLPPRYSRPVGRPTKGDPKWLQEYDAKGVLAYLDQPERERVSHDEVFDNAMKIQREKASEGHHALLDNIIRALGWIELIETHSDGSQEVFWFKNDPRKEA